MATCEIGTNNSLNNNNANNNSINANNSSSNNNANNANNDANNSSNTTTIALVCATVVVVALIVALTISRIVTSKKKSDSGGKPKEELNDLYGTYYQGVEYNNATEQNPRYNEDQGDAVVTDANPLYYQLSSSSSDNPGHNDNVSNTEGNLYCQL